MRDFFTKDLGWKLFSLGLAITLYLTVRAVRNSMGDTERPLEVRAVHTFEKVPVLVVSAAADVRQFKVNPETVNVTLRSLPETLYKVTHDDIRVTVDLTGIESTQSVQKRIHVSTLPGITLIAVDPPEVIVVVPPKK